MTVWRHATRMTANPQTLFTLPASQPVALSSQEGVLHNQKATDILDTSNESMIHKCRPAVQGLPVVRPVTSILYFIMHQYTFTQVNTEQHWFVLAVWKWASAVACGMLRPWNGLQAQARQKGDSLEIQIQYSMWQGIAGVRHSTCNRQSQ